MNINKLIIPKCVLFLSTLLYSFVSYSQSLDNSITTNILEQLLKNEISSNNLFKEFSDNTEYQTSEDRIHNLTEENIETIRNYLISDHRRESNLEKEYKERAKTRLSLIGYDMFQKLYDTNLKSLKKRVGGVQDNYIIGQGDEIIIQLKGGKNQRIVKKVLNNGRIILPFSEPLIVAGLTFQETKELIQSAVKESLIETDAYISLGEIKQINVTVSGEVNIPGQYTVSSLSSVLDVILMSGGIKKQGSLRNISIFSNGKKKNLDLYNIIFGLNPSELQSTFLSEGSLILVPPIGKTVGIVGSVNRPGIYEFSANKTKISDIFSLSGANSILREFFVKRLTDDMLDKVNLNLQINDFVSNKDLIFIIPKEMSSSGLVNVQGSVKIPFSYPIEKYSSLSKIIPNEKFLREDAISLPLF